MSRADLALGAALRAMAPLIGLLLREGVTYSRFANALKTSFLEAAPDILKSSSARLTDSSISTLTGIHRKDVHSWRSEGQPRPQTRTLSVAMAVFARWSNDPAYCDRKGRPRVLDRFGGAGSFEALATGISNDVHPHTLLQELKRLGVVRLAQGSKRNPAEKVQLCMDAFVPAEGAAEMLELLADNVGDHLAAAVHNVLVLGMPMLEQSVFADGLTPRSVDRISSLARKAWSTALRDIVKEATALSARDQQAPEADQRFRAGMYFFHGPQKQQNDSAARDD
ncbi:MAG TPA: DUF6502 family protein [Ramlibacter sp.]|nr:DUF6502 family protein [Ramlibacter sp.]